MLAAVGERADERVGYGIEDAARGGDETDDGKTSENGALGDEELMALGKKRRARLVEVDEPVADNARKHGPAQLTDCKEPEHAISCQLLAFGKDDFLFFGLFCLLAPFFPARFSVWFLLGRGS